VAEIVMCEMEYGAWTLMHRYQKARELLTNGMVDTTDKHQVAFIFIWLRFSALRQLDWQRRYNTKPKDL